MTETTATAAISTTDFRSALSAALEEAFVQVHGIFLDKGDSLLETLAGISAEQASQPLGPRSGNIAAKVNHMCVYIEAVAANAAAGEYLPVDWEGSWKVGAVDDAAWQALVDRLRTNYESLRTFIASNETWDERFIGGAFGLVAHNAYHLGEIRQALAAIAADDAL
jgi:hypothetical protein